MNKWKFAALLQVIIGVSLLGGHAQASSAGGDVTKEEIIALTPRLTLEDEGISSYGMRVKLRVSEAVSLDLLAFEERSGNSGLILFDPADGTPMLVVLGDEVLYYDPLQGGVIVRSGSYSLHLAYEQNASGENGLNFNFVISDKKRGEREPNHNLIDVRSLISGSTCSQITLNEVDAGNHVATCRSRLGNLSEIRFERREERNRFLQYSILSQDENGADSIKMHMRLINLNTPIAEKWFKIPDRALARAGLLVVDKTGEEATQPISVNTVVLSIMLRLVPTMHEDSPERKKLESYLPDNFDWDAFGRIDRNSAKILRSTYADGKSLDSLSTP